MDATPTGHPGEGRGPGREARLGVGVSGSAFLDAQRPVTWIPASAGMTGGGRADWALPVTRKDATPTGHPGEGRGPGREAVLGVGVSGSAFLDAQRPMTWIPASAGMTGGII